MGKRRPKLSPDTPWEQLQLQFTSEEQRDYERIRPIVLFGHSLPERAQETQTPERTLRRQVAAFDQHGMRSLVPADTPKPFQRVPAPIHDMILDLHAEHPPMRPNEIATICYLRTGYHPSPHTIKQLLAKAVPSTQHQRRFPPYHAISDPFERRRAIVRLHAEGWNKKSIAAYLQISRQTVHTTLRRWIEEGLQGLPHKSRARRPRPRRVTLRTIEAVRKLQRNPQLGAWRIAAALKQQGIPASPRTVTRIMARNREVYAELQHPPRVPQTKQTMPYLAVRRHQYWTVDIRYIDVHRLGGGMVYCITILDNYSRAVIASALIRSQDLTAYLMVLYAAIQSCGAPEVLVSDSGSVFRAKRAQAIYRALGIRKEYIARRQPWQSYIETQFNVQRRMADFHFAQAATWEEIVGVHERWVTDFNFQDHWAHRARRDERFSPADVLAWVRGRPFEERQLQRIFYTLRTSRRVDQHGYVRFRHYRVYSERGVSGRDVVLWLYKETLTVTFREQTLAAYTVKYARRRQEFESIHDPILYPSTVQSSQRTLWDLTDDDWYKVVRLPRYRPYQRGSRRPHPLQLAFTLDDTCSNTAA
jgi:putative transposase